MPEPHPPLGRIPGEPSPTGFELLVYESDAAFCDRLAELHPELASLLADHRHDNDETLAHVFMADVERWFEEKYRAGEQEPALALAGWLDEEYPSASPSIENVICVSFLEMLPWPPDSDAEAIAGMLGPSLRRSLQEMQDWEPDSSG
jgi:hypothetical protein